MGAIKNSGTSNEFESYPLRSPIDENE